jgi:hypothetical protein
VKKVSVEKRYAIAVRDEACLFLFMWVRWVERQKCGEFFAFLPRPHDTSINAHASYHADGGYHIKSHDMSNRNRIMRQLKQRPDQKFVGTAHLLDQRIDQQGPRAIGQNCSPGVFSEIFEIPVAELGTGELNKHVSADLVSQGHGPNLVPNARVIRQREYEDVFPFIVFTLYAMPTLGG